MKRFVIIDNCTSKRASIYDKVFQTEEEAIETAKAEWEALTQHDKAERDAYYVASCTIDEDGEVDWDSVDPIIEFC